MKNILLIVLLSAVGAFAESRFLDRDFLRQCGGSVELREAANGDLSIQFENLGYRCDRLVFFDASSGRTLKSYNINGSSYTLSQSQRASLSSDCKVGFSVSDSKNKYKKDTMYVTLGWWCAGHNQPSYPVNNRSYQESNKGNCKLLINGEYSNKNVSDMFCSPVHGSKDIVSYEYSQKHNCKVMINGQYANKNVSDYYCDARP